MRKIIFYVILAIASTFFVTRAIAQTMPNRDQGVRPALNSNSSSGIQMPPPSGIQRSGPNAISGFQEKPAANASEFMGKPEGAGQPGSASGNLQQKCKTVEKVITEQAQKGSSMLVQIYQQLTAIFTGVQTYYSQKLVPNGVSLQNYSILVSTVQASQSAALTSIQAAQQDAKNFSCSGNQPGQQISKFRSDMQTALKAIISYRDAIKNFVEAVKTAAQNVTETTNTASNSAQQ
ncbi:MAG TPA: hypothetical protein VF820_06625 [Patescibacteria group bacterium]